MMKRLLHTLFLGFLSLSSISACTCFPTPFCDYTEELEMNETMLIFMGSFIQKDSFNTWSDAMQFKVEQLYQGEIITPDSPEYAGEIFTNSETKIWLLSGPGEICQRYLSEDRAIFAVRYSPGHFGYVPSECHMDYFPISDNGTVTGFFDDFDSETLAVSTFEDIIRTKCRTTLSNDDLSKKHALETLIYPQPAIDQIYIEMSDPIDQWEVELFDAIGQRVKQIKTNTVDLNALEPAVYILKFVKDELHFARRIVKV